jgi:CRP-like cAMP-binding protein
MRATTSAVLPRHFRSQFLDGLTPLEIESALAAATHERISCDQVLQREGDRATRLWLLVTGRVAVYRLVDNGDKLFLRWGVPGDIYGLSTILRRRERYVVTIEAVQEGSLLAWDRGSSRALALGCPNVNEALNTVVANYLDQLINMLGRYALQCAEQRLARVLVDSARQLGREGSEGIEIDLTNEQLAVAARMTVFTATRKLRKWRGLGILTKRRGKVVLPSLSRFESVTGTEPSRMPRA